METDLLLKGLGPELALLSVPIFQQIKSKCVRNVIPSIFIPVSIGKESRGKRYGLLYK